MRRLVVWMAIASSVFLATSAGAKPEYVDVMVEAYKPSAASLTERSCATCHFEDEKFSLNPYGLMVHQGLMPAGEKPLDAAILTAIEPLDADLDGVRNVDEIKAGTNPADPKSVSAAGPAPDGSAGAPPPPVSPAKPAFVPKHAWHPAIVHFPLGLFMAGLLLDFLGMIRKEKTLLFAGWYNLVLAALTSVAAVVAGYFAMLFLRVPFNGIIREHILYALAGTVVMWILVALRVHKHENMSRPLRIVYYVVALAGMLMISWSGHLGGEFVYGH